MPVEQKNLINVVARLSPWLTPIPSAFFVARSSLNLLDTGIIVAIVIALVIETTGLSSVHIALVLYEYNQKKLKREPMAPAWLSVGMSAVYLAAVIVLTIILEILPELATYALIVFPVMVVTGAVNIALLTQHDARLIGNERMREERREAREKARVAKEKAKVIEVKEPVIEEPVTVKGWDDLLAEIQANKIDTSPGAMTGERLFTLGYGGSVSTAARLLKRARSNGHT